MVQTLWRPPKHNSIVGNITSKRKEVFFCFFQPGEQTRMRLARAGTATIDIWDKSEDEPHRAAQFSSSSGQELTIALVPPVHRRLLLAKISFDVGRTVAESRRRDQRKPPMYPADRPVIVQTRPHLVLLGFRLTCP